MDARDARHTRHRKKKKKKASKMRQETLTLRKKKISKISYLYFLKKCKGQKCGVFTLCIVAFSRCYRSKKNPNRSTTSVPPDDHLRPLPFDFLSAHFASQRDSFWTKRRRRRRRLQKVLMAQFEILASSLFFFSLSSLREEGLYTHKYGQKKKDCGRPLLLHLLLLCNWLQNSGINFIGKISRPSSEQYGLVL